MRDLRKQNWVFGLSVIAFAMASVCTSLAEEDGKTADQYVIVELEPISMTKKEMDSANTEQTSQADSILFSLQDSGDTDEYCITGICANEPIVAQILTHTTADFAYDAASVYELVLKQQTVEQLDYSCDFNLQIPEDAAITLYQRNDEKLQKSTLDVAYTDEKYNRLPLICYPSETNHWLVFHLGTSTDRMDLNVEDAANESAAASLEGKIETKAEEIETANQQTTQETQRNEPQTKSETPSSTAPQTSASTTAHVHAWVPVTNVVHHEATYKDVWVQDVAAWDETVVTKAAWDETVLIQAAYEEQVMVRDAYDEPIYDWVDICNECGHKFFDPSDDINEHMAAGCWSGWHAERLQVGTTHHEAVYQTLHHDAVYQTIHHDAETTVLHHAATGHMEKTIDQAAWDETVEIGYTCSGCGATKEK